MMWACPLPMHGGHHVHVSQFIDSAWDFLRNEIRADTLSGAQANLSDIRDRAWTVSDPARFRDYTIRRGPKIAAVWRMPATVVAASSKTLPSGPPPLFAQRISSADRAVRSGPSPASLRKPARDGTQIRA